MQMLYKRTHMCGELRLADEGKNVVLNGWVAKARSLGGLVFVDIRDKSGITQVTFNEDVPADVQRLRDVVETMTDKQKQVYTLHVLQGYSFTEISKMIQTSVPNVTKHFEKAKDHIRKNF